METFSPGLQPMLRIGLVTYPHCQPAGLFAISDLLEILNLQVGRERFRPVWVSTGGHVPLSWHSHQVHGGSRLEDTDCDLWVVPPLRMSDLDGLEHALHLARPVSEQLSERSGLFWTYCSGALVLAQSGISDGHRLATERWLMPHAPRRFPDVRWDFDSPLVHDGEFSSASGLQGYRKILGDWISARFGNEMLHTLEVAQFLPTPSRKPSAFGPVDDDEIVDPRLRRLLRAARERAAHSVGLRWASDFLEMSPRSFSRFVLEKTSISAGDWLRRVKLHQVGRKLVSSGATIKEISSEMGFASQAGLHRSFQQVTGYTPTQYRRLFGEGELLAPERC